MKTSPVACPTLSARSAVITPLARPRMPSVPKYLRAITSPIPLSGCAFAPCRGLADPREAPFGDFTTILTPNPSCNAAMITDLAEIANRPLHSLPDHDDMQPARAVGPEDQRLLDIGGARGAGDHVDRSRHGSVNMITGDVLRLDDHDVVVGEEIERGR